MTITVLIQLILSTINSIQNHKIVLFIKCLLILVVFYMSLQQGDLKNILNELVRQLPDYLDSS